jgi:hypothetical protein
MFKKGAAFLVLMGDKGFPSQPAKDKKVSTYQDPTTQKRLKKRGEIGITRYTRKTERIFFFYATIAMFILWRILKLFGD